MSGCGGLFDERFWDDLLIAPASVTEHTVGDAGQVAGGHAEAMGRMAAVFFGAIVELEPVMFDAEGLEEGFDGELVVRLAGDVFANQGGMGEGVS